MKLICPWCGAHGHDGATEKERRTPPGFEFYGTADDGRLYAFKCLNCGEGVGATRAMGRVRSLEPESWRDLEEHVANVTDPFVNKYFPTVVAAQGIGAARRLMTAMASGSTRELTKALSLCKQAGQEQAAEEGLRRMQEDAAAGRLPLPEP